MAEIKQDPQKLREFCKSLEAHSAYWEKATEELDRYMARLGQSWKDDEFKAFKDETASLRRSLANFREHTKYTVAELRQDADKLERYQRIKS